MLYSAVSLIAQSIVRLVCADPIAGCKTRGSQYSEQQRDHQGQGENRTALRSPDDRKERPPEHLIWRFGLLRVFVFVFFCRLALTGWVLYLCLCQILTRGGIWL